MPYAKPMTLGSVTCVTSALSPPTPIPTYHNAGDITLYFPTRYYVVFTSMIDGRAT